MKDKFTVLLKDGSLTFKYTFTCVGDNVSIATYGRISEAVKKILSSEKEPDVELMHYTDLGESFTEKHKVLDDMISQFKNICGEPKK